VFRRIQSSHPSRTMRQQHIIQAGLFEHLLNTRLERIGGDIAVARLASGIDRFSDEGFAGPRSLGDRPRSFAALCAAEAISAIELRGRLGFGGTNVRAENFAPAVAVDAKCDNHRDRQGRF